MGIINRLIIHLGSKPNSYSLNHHHHQYHHHHHHQSSNNWSRIKPNSSLPLCRLDFRLTAGFSRPLTYERQNKSIKCPALPQQSYFDDLLPVSCHSLTLFRILLPFQNQTSNAKLHLGSPFSLPPPLQRLLLSCSRILVSSWNSHLVSDSLFPSVLEPKQGAIASLELSVVSRLKMKLPDCFNITVKSFLLLIFLILLLNYLNRRHKYLSQIWNRTNVKATYQRIQSFDFLR